MLTTEVTDPSILTGNSTATWLVQRLTADATPFGVVSAWANAVGAPPEDLPLAPVVDVLAGRPRPAVDVARALARWLERHSGGHPLLVMVRGVSDPDSLRVLGALRSRLESLPVLVVLDHGPVSDAPDPTGTTVGDDSALSWARERAETGRAALREGRWLAARCDLDAALPVLRGSTVQPGARFLASYVSAALARGEVGRVQEVEPDLRALLAPHDPDAARVHFALGRIAAAGGRYDEAWRLFAAAGADDEEAVRPDPALPWRDEAAMAAMHTGRHGAAQTLALASVALAEAGGDSYSLAHALRVAAVFDDDQVGTLTRALGLLVAPSRLRAQLQLDLAAQQVLMRAPREDTLALVRRAEKYADRHQLNPLLNRVDRLLPLLGAPAVRLVPPAVASLSAQELRVAFLAAAGHDDAHIATELFLTEAEVATDVTRVMRKLHLRLRTRIGRPLTALEPIGDQPAGRLT